MKWFDPYLGVGVGYTDANNTPRGTYNAIIGFRAWLTERLGLDLNATGKWSIGTEASNHIQYGVGVVYNLKTEKGLSKKGKEKKRVNDSIDNFARAKEAKQLAEILAKEKEKQRLEAIEQAKIDKKNKQKAYLENSITQLGNVYFELNSSYLTKTAKGTLDRLGLMLQENPNIDLKIGSHTDSRGKSLYNKWLSEKRVLRTATYLVKMGINSKRLSTESYGEEILLNECDDDTYYSEEKHQVNRRSEFSITKF